MNPVLKLFSNLINNGFEFFGRYYSSYRGFVVDNADPDGFGRLQLRIPQVTGSQVLEYWAWQKDCYSGKGYGMQAIPNIKDMVWVEFEQGDPRKPVWSYGHFANDPLTGLPEKPDELKNVQNYWFKTPYGHLVSFDDLNKIITLKTKDGHSITINDDNKLLKLTTASGNRVDLDDDNNLIDIIHKDGSKIVIEGSVISFNDGNNDGLVKVASLVSKLNNLESDLNAIKLVFSTTWVPVPSDGGAALKAAAITWASQTINPTTKANLENTEVKH